jgi:hypothetical protein
VCGHNGRAAIELRRMETRFDDRVLLTGTVAQSKSDKLGRDAEWRCCNVTA